MDEALDTLTCSETLVVCVGGRGRQCHANEGVEDKDLRVMRLRGGGSLVADGGGGSGDLWGWSDGVEWDEIG